MAEYIERERARFEFERFFKAEEKTQNDCDSLLSMLPSADVAEVKHGEWILEHDTYGNMICSLCKEEALLNDYDEYVDSNCCPNCGAKMDGERRSENESV